MINNPNFLLGVSFGLLTLIRDHLIRNNDITGIEIIEDQYQKLSQVLDLNLI